MKTKKEKFSNVVNENDQLVLIAKKILSEHKHAFEVLGQ